MVEKVLGNPSVKRVRAALEAAGIVTQVGFMYRFGAAIQYLRRLIASGEAGPVGLMTARYFCNSLHADWWRQRDKSGGQLVEQVIHMVDLMRYLLGDAATVYSLQQNVFHTEVPDYTVEDVSGTVFGFANGGIGVLYATNGAIPGKWINEDEEGSKNANEEEFLAAQLKSLGRNVKYSYHKITNITAGKKLAESMNNLMGNALNVIVYNFVDMLSHARTEMEIIRELAEDEPAYRSLTKSWFEHSPLLDMLKFIAEKGCRLVITTDHGTVRVTEPSKVVGDRNTNTNLRYKHGKNLTYEAKDVFAVKDPSKALLPRAKRIIVALDRDDTAVLVTLTARRLNPTAAIVASVRESQNIDVVRQSGADARLTTNMFHRAALTL